MSEIISLHLGNTGIKTAESLWELYAKSYEHPGEYCDQKNGINKLFRTFGSSPRGLLLDPTIPFDCSTSKARAILVDTEADPIDNIYRSSRSHFFDTNNIFTSGECSGSVYARVYHSLAPNLAEKIVESIRKEVERANSLEGFNLTHSVSGGTGAALWTYISEHLEENYKKKERVSFDILSSDKFASTGVEPLNQVLGMAKLAELSRSSCYFEMAQISKFVSQILKADPGSQSRKNHLQTINQVIAYHSYKIMSGIAQNGCLLDSLSEITKSTTIFKGLPFSSSSLSLEAVTSDDEPTEWENITIHKTNIDTLNKHLNSTRINPLTTVDETSKHYQMSTLYQGLNFAPKDVGQDLVMNLKRILRFTECVPSRLRFGIDYGLPPCLKNSRLRIPDQNVMIFHGLSNFYKIIDRIILDFDKVYKQKLFLHHYDVEGMDLDEFDLAVEELRQCSNNYKDISADTEEEEGEEEE